MTIDNPGFTLPTSNERELLLSYLRAQRGDVVDPPTDWTRRSSGGRPTIASCRSSG